MRKIKIAIGQMNPVVGDYAANVKKMISWARKAESKGAELIVFPELALTGYPVWDLANKKGFIREGLRALERIIQSTRKMKITLVTGYIDHPEMAAEFGLGHEVPHNPRAKQAAYNTLAWIQGGKLKQKYHKRLLPTYDVFLEDIFFQPGRVSHVIPWKSLKIGPTICEDIWDDRYEKKPLRALSRQKADLVINISASPYFRGVSDVRDGLIKKQASRYGFPLLYVNQVGAQDDLIFDGRSLFVDGSGHIVFRAPAFKEDLFFVEWCPSDRGERFSLASDPLSSQPEEMYRALCVGIRDYLRKNRFKKAVIGLSGGIDSALTAALAADALGPEVVLGITMPSGFSTRGSWKDSEELARNLGIEFRNHSIKGKYDYLLKAYHRHKKQEGLKVPPPGTVTLAMENLQARLRGLELMYISNDEGRILLSTGNKSEMAVGYCTLYGDMAGGLAVLGDVYKTDVYRLCRFRNSISEVIPRSTLEKAPSAELRPDQKDEDSLPPYPVLDEVLYLYIEKNMSRGEITAALKKSGVSAKTVGDVIRKVDHNEYKRRQTPPILRVTEKAWFGRRMPITNCFDR